MIKSREPAINWGVILSPRNATDRKVAVRGIINMNIDALGASRRAWPRRREAIQTPVQLPSKQLGRLVVFIHIDSFSHGGQEAYYCQDKCGQRALLLLGQVLAREVINAPEFSHKSLLETY
jgi:hypothetical protein